MINFLKKWNSRIGSLLISQSAQPIGDGDELLIITTIHEPRIQCVSSRIPASDLEKLGDDAFRMEVARRDITRLVGELREMVEFAEKALAQPA